MTRALMLATAYLLCSSAAFADPVRYEYSYATLWVGFDGDLSGIDLSGATESGDVPAYGALRFTVPADVDPLATSLVLPESRFRMVLPRSPGGTGQPHSASGPMTVELHFPTEPWDSVMFTVSVAGAPQGFRFWGYTEYASALELLLNLGTAPWPVVQLVNSEFSTGPALMYDDGFSLSGPWLVPEPGSLLLSSLGLVALGTIRRWRAAGSQPVA